MTFRLNEKIDPAASFGLHEDISRFVKGEQAPGIRADWLGSLVPASSAPDVLRPDILFATPDGRLGIIGELTPEATVTLDGLQRNMDKYHKGPGGVTWRTYVTLQLPS